MSGHSEYVITPADRTTLLQGPVGAILMLGGDRTAGSPAVLLLTAGTAGAKAPCWQQLINDWLSGSEREISLASLVRCTPEINSRLP